MLESCYRPLERCFGSESSSADVLLWHMDLKQHASGDYSIAVVQANSSLEDQGQVFTSPSATYVGVYDGHGGPQASRFITNHLFPYLHSTFPKTLIFYFRSFYSLYLYTHLCMYSTIWIHINTQRVNLYTKGNIFVKPLFSWWANQEDFEAFGLNFRGILFSHPQN